MAAAERRQVLDQAVVEAPRGAWPFSCTPYYDYDAGYLAAWTAVARNPEAARAFIEYLRTPAAQRAFWANGYRPVDDEVLGETDFPRPKQLFTIADLGGWDRVMDEFFDRENGVMAGIERDLADAAASARAFAERWRGRIAIADLDLANLLEAIRDYERIHEVGSRPYFYA